MTRMNDAEFAAWSPGEAMLADRSGVSLDWLEIDDDGESFAALRALPGTPNPRPRLAFHVLVIGFRCFPRTRLSLHRPADMNSFGPSPQLCVQGALPRRKPDHDRETAGSHAGADNRAVCAPCPGFHPERRGADHWEHRWDSHTLSMVNDRRAHSDTALPGRRTAAVLDAFD